MKDKIIALFILSMVSVLGSCEHYNVDLVKSITLNKNAIDLKASETFQLSVQDETGATIVWYSNDKSIANVDSGLVTALSMGTAFITADIGSAKAVCQVTVTAEGNVLPLEGLSTPLSDTIVYAKGIKLIAPYRVMQGFDIDKAGNIYFMQLGAVNGNVVNQTKSHELYVIKTPKGTSEISEYMTLQYFGHGSNMVIEENKDGNVYVWLNSNASRNALTEEYSNSQTISRVKFEPGKVIKDGYSDENFFWDEKLLNLHPAIDFVNKKFLVTATESGTRYFYTYNLDKVMELPVVEHTLTVTAGGETTGNPLSTKTRTIQGRNLSLLQPIGKFKILVGKNKDEDINSYSMQGMDIQDNYIYFNEGDGNGNLLVNGKSNNYVTVFDIYGNIIRPRTRVEAIDNLSVLNDFNITDTGYMEAEGIKVKGNLIYLGFASRSTIEKDNDYRRANIFIYDTTVASN